MLFDKVGGGGDYTTPIAMIDSLIILDLLGAPDAHIPNTHPETFFIFERLVDIQNRLSRSKLVSRTLQKRVLNPHDGGIFKEGQSHIGPEAIQDDHVPFYNLGVPVCHLIPVPFPSVWHTVDDNGSCIHEETVTDLAIIFRVFVVEYLGLKI